MCLRLWFFFLFLGVSFLIVCFRLLRLSCREGRFFWGVFLLVCFLFFESNELKNEFVRLGGFVVVFWKMFVLLRVLLKLVFILLVGCWVVGFKMFVRLLLRFDCCCCVVFRLLLKLLLKLLLRMDVWGVVFLFNVFLKIFLFVVVVVVVGVVVVVVLLNRGVDVVVVVVLLNNDFWGVVEVVLVVGLGLLNRLVVVVVGVVGLEKSEFKLLVVVVGGFVVLVVKFLVESGIGGVFFFRLLNIMWFEILFFL